MDAGELLEEKENMPKTIDSSKPILVTGASGFIASRIVKDLLDKGLHVRGTVRSLAKREKYSFLEKIAAEGTGKLELFEADLLKQGSFAEAMAGCELVMHTASPFLTQVKDPQRQLVDPALEGTRNVLNAVNQTASVKRVVLTASVVSMYGAAKELQSKKGKMLHEDDWNESSSLDHQPYPYSKTVAEREAWKINGAQDRWDMVTIHPAFVMGPSLTTASASTSLDFMVSMLSGKLKMGVPDMYFGLVDVREVALAHVMAGLTPEAHGRYIVCRREGVGMLEMAEALSAHFGDKYPLPSRKLPRFLVILFGPLQGFSRRYLRESLGYRLAFDNARSSKELGINYRPWQDSVVALAEQLIEDGALEA